VKTGRRHAVWGFVSIERRSGRRQSETGFQERWPVGRPLVGRLGGGLCEMRTTFDRNEYRVYLYKERKHVVVVHSTMMLVHGIHKKTPAADLALAQRRMKEST
jgi:phage-related protein